MAPAQACGQTSAARWFNGKLAPNLEALSVVRTLQRKRRHDVNSGRHWVHPKKAVDGSA